MGSLSFLSRTDDWLARDEEQAVRSGPAFSDRLKHMSVEQLVEQVDRRRSAAPLGVNRQFARAWEVDTDTDTD